MGLTVGDASSNRLVLEVSGTAQQVETAFGVHLMNYRAPDNRVFRAPDAAPTVPAALASRIAGIIGLDTAVVRRPHYVKRSAISRVQKPHVGTGPADGYAPSDIKTAYNLDTTGLDGSGQTLGLYELDGYTASDITAYEKYFNLAAVPLQNVLLNGVDGSAGSGAGEVTLDIELMIALAPGVTKIIVYEAPNSDAGSIICFNRMATDNLAKAISVSWGSPEATSNTPTLDTENKILKQMAVQGQSIFAAAGDDGAYDDKVNLGVDNPASQPYMTGVGGTSLPDMPGMETSWGTPPMVTGVAGDPNGGGGGGISGYWPLPTWQKNAYPTAAGSGASTTMRNVPDVSLNADPMTGYSVYFNGRWGSVGGTSAAAPLWAAFTALVNQAQVRLGFQTAGFLNPQIYAIGKGPSYGGDFNDIKDMSTNLFYKAVAGCDLATGWGSFKGVNLLADLAGITVGDIVSRNLIWQDSASGKVAYWGMNGTTFVKTGTIATDIPANWKIVAVADITGDGVADLLWENTATGDYAYWQMNGTQIAARGPLAFGIPLGWQIVGVADVAGDTKNDIIWQNTTTGEVAYWQMNGVRYVSSGSITSGIPSNWKIVGVADITGHSKADLLWENTNTGDYAYWQMNGVQYVSSGSLASRVPLNWQIDAVGDFTGEGKNNLIWQNTRVGSFYYWQLDYWQTNGPTLQASSLLTSDIPTSWKIVGIQ